MNRNDTDGNANNADVFTLGNFGTNVAVSTAEQQLEIQNGNPANTDTINFGSGAYAITDAVHVAPASHSYVNTAANGAGLAIAANIPTQQPWAEIANAIAGDTLQFKGDTVQNTFNIGPQTFATGIAMALANTGSTRTQFSTLREIRTSLTMRARSNVSISAADALVEIIGHRFQRRYHRPRWCTLAYTRDLTLSRGDRPRLGAAGRDKQYQQRGLRFHCRRSSTVTGQLKTRRIL